MKNVRLMKFAPKTDKRGDIVFLESGKNIPFRMQRIYYIIGNKKKAVRGRHAYKNVKQILICLKGSCECLVRNKRESKIVKLNNRNTGLYIGEYVWRAVTNFSKDCVLLSITNRNLKGLKEA